MQSSEKAGFDHFPEYFRGAAERLHSLGYEVEFRKKPGDFTSSRYRDQVVLDAVSENMARVRITIHRTQDKEHGRVELAGSLRVGGQQIRFFDLLTIDRMWRFAELDGLCWCGKLPMSESEARENLDNALRERVLYKNRRRREIRYYRCHAWPGMFHLTSKDYSETNGEDPG
jgi:hypothetical protein